MREGFNPNKDLEFIGDDCFHQIIIPVYIPNNKVYFKDSLKILKKCLQSLVGTIHHKTFITIVNNGSCDEVISYLNDCINEQIIDEVIHTSNIGKVNAIYKGLTGHNFKLITISDADVLFLGNWQDAVYDIFTAFKKTGAVCTTPSPRSYNSNSFNSWFDNFFSNKFKFEKVLDTKALLKFSESIGDVNFYNNYHLEQQLMITKGTTKAVVGAGHFVTTYRADILYDFKFNHSNKLLGGDSESKNLDAIILKNGLWRLSTIKNYTYHMGNVFETWMENETIKNQILDKSQPKIYTYKNTSKITYLIKNKLFKKIIKLPFIYWKFLVFKGLNKEAISKY